MQIAEEARVAPPRMTGAAGALQKAEQWLGSVVAAIAALLVVAEVVVVRADHVDPPSVDSWMTVRVD